MDLMALVASVCFHSLRALNQGASPENALSSNGLVAWIGAVTGSLSLFLLWYRGRSKLNIQIIGSEHDYVDSSNFSGTTISTSVRIRNTGDAPTTIFKVELTVENEGAFFSETFSLSNISSDAFPYVARGVPVLGHDAVEIPIYFNFSSLRLPEKKDFFIHIWHTHGCSRAIFGTSSRKAAG